MDLTTAAFFPEEYLTGHDAFFCYLVICLVPQLQAWAGAPGKQHPSLEFMRYAYASGTVYLFWIYVHSTELGTNLQTFTLIAILAGRYYAYLFTTAWMAFEFAGTMVALAAYLYQSLPPGPAHAGAASALGLMLLAEAGLFIKRCDDEAMRRKAD